LEPASWYELVAAAACLLLVALTAATETVLAQISRQRLRELAEEQGRAASNVDRLLARSPHYANAMALLRAGGSVAFALLVASTFAREHVSGGFFAAFGVAATLLLLFGFTMPVGLARRSRESTAANLLTFAIVATILSRPLLAVYDVLIRIGRRVMRRRSPEVLPVPLVGEDLVPALGPALVRSEEVSLASDEQEMIDAVRDLDDHTVRKIMTTRLDVVALPDDAPLAQAIALVQQTGYSRLPVYRSTIDHVVGLLYAKDLLRFVTRDVPPATVVSLMRPVRLIVPESKFIDALLADMRRTRQHLALIADEYGGTAGIVTIEDILEEIVGAIDDEHDETTDPEIVAVSDSEYLVDGRVSIDDVSDELGLHWAEEDEDITLAGLVQRELGHLPIIGESVDFDGARITVLEVDGYRLERLRVEKLNGPDDSLFANGNGNGNGHSSENLARVGGGEGK
jgi:CBS domain containing-hemolysin-like protein